MFLKLNGIEIGGKSSYQITPPVSGLEKPPIRTGSGEYSGRDGGYVSGQFYSSRVIVINGFYNAGTCDKADTLRRNLSNALPIRRTMPLFITTFSGDRYLTEGYLRDFKMDMTSSKSGIFQITIIAPDPFLYDAGDGVNPESGFITAIFGKLKPGGYITPYILPVTWQAGSQPVPITNSGVIAVAPQIILEGKFTNPKITNNTTGEFIKLNRTTNSSDKIVINMAEREITLNGGSIASARTLDSKWWLLQSGVNRIQLDTDSVDDKDNGQIRWRTAYEGA